jgi:hypothetical protein
MPSILFNFSKIISLLLMKASFICCVVDLGSASIALSAAFCATAQVAEVTCPCILLHALAIHSGAPIKPTRQPVIANPFETPLTVIVGFIGAPLWIAKACNKIQGQVTSATCAVAQKAAERAMLSDPRSTTQEMKDTFLKRRDMILAELNNIEGIKCNVPQGAFYVFPDVSYYFGKSDGTTTINNADDFCMYLLNPAHVALVAGDSFGNPECVRISYAAADEKLMQAMDRIKKQLAQLN